jgi:hypothetical protein
MDFSSDLRISQWFTRDFRESVRDIFATWSFQSHEWGRLAVLKECKSSYLTTNTCSYMHALIYNRWKMLF